MATAERVVEKRPLRVNLSNAHLPGANLKSAQLKGSDFHGANLAGADFEGAVLCEANFSGSRLIDANFKHADLRGANFSMSDLSNASLVGANVSNVDFSGVTLKGTDLRDTDLTNTKGLNWNSLFDSNINLGTNLPKELRKDDLVGFLKENYPKFRWQHDDGDDLPMLIGSLLDLHDKYEQSSICATLYRFNQIQAEIENSNE